MSTRHNFTTGAAQYAQFRPRYPQALFDYLYTLVPAFDAAWDCGTGNGQVAGVLAERFAQVWATDVSAAQLEQAIQKPNIHYRLQPAEQTDFPDDSFDLITVAQAIHWFDFDRFYAEVRRTARPGAVLAVVGYGRFRVDAAIDALIDAFYHDTLGPYWDAQRRYIDEDYRTLPFPFEALPAPALQMDYEWTLEHVVGYLNTWSAVKHYKELQDHNPVDALAPRLQAVWGADASRRISFPLLLRAGLVHPVLGAIEQL